MIEPKKYKPTFNLEKRTFNFAKDIRIFGKSLTRSLINFDDAKQLLRSSGSIGANYIEANEALGPKDFLMRLRISRKEAIELTKILSSIIVKSQKSKKL